MKKLLSKFLIICIYIVFIGVMAGFRIDMIIDAKGLCAVVIGAVFFTVPVATRLLQNRNLQSSDNKSTVIISALSQNALYAGYLAAFIFTFARLSGNNVDDNMSLAPIIAMNCRPLLYGFALYILFKRDDRNDENKEIEEVAERAASVQNSDKSYDAEQLYYYYRAKGLTQREAEVARLMYNNLSNGEIAEQLCISETTVKKHVAHIFEKLNVTSRKQLTADELKL